MPTRIRLGSSFNSILYQAYRELDEICQRGVKKLCGHKCKATHTGGLLIYQFKWAASCKIYTTRLNSSLALTLQSSPLSWQHRYKISKQCFVSVMLFINLTALQYMYILTVISCVLSINVVNVHVNCTISCLKEQKKKSANVFQWSILTAWYNLVWTHTPLEPTLRDLSSCKHTWFSD